MDAAELRELLTPEALALLDSLAPSDSTADVVALVAGLRKQGHPPARVAAVLTQYRLRRKAEEKFGPFAQRMLFTAEGLLFADAGPVVEALARARGLTLAEVVRRYGADGTGEPKQLGV